MNKKKRSFGSVLLSFIRGIVMLALIIVVAVSVGVNVLFYDDNCSPKIDIADWHYTFFLNNSEDTQNIPKGSLVIADHKNFPNEDEISYVLCTIGNGYKTVLCLSGKVENENGSISYIVQGDKVDSTANYQIPSNRINGKVLRKNDMAGEIILFARDIKGIIALMAVPAFLLIILSIIGIKRNRSRYEDDVIEADLLIEELRKAKKEEMKAAQAKKNAEKSVKKQVKEIETEKQFKSEVAKKSEDVKIFTPSPSPAPAPIPKKNDSYIDFSEYEKPAVKKPEPVKQPEPIKQPEIESEPEINITANEILKRMSEEMKVENPSSNYSVYDEQLNPSKPVYQPKPAQNDQAYNENSKVETQKSKPKKPKASVKKLDAETIDDLIKIIEDEKKKLD